MCRLLPGTQSNRARGDFSLHCSRTIIGRISLHSFINDSVLARVTFLGDDNEHFAITIGCCRSSASKLSKEARWRMHASCMVSSESEAPASSKSHIVSKSSRHLRGCRGQERASSLGRVISLSLSGSLLVCDLLSMCHMSHANFHNAAYLAHELEFRSGNF